MRGASSRSLSEFISVSSATIENHGFTFGADDLLRRPPYLRTVR